jgi:predicted dehydrogenase
LHNRDHGDLEVSALCHFTLANAVYASASLDYFRPPSAPTHGDDRVRVVGTEGVIEVQGGEAFLINDKAQGKQHLTPACDKQIFQDFVMHVEDKSSALLDAQDTFIVTQACLLARQSADEGCIVEF